MRLLKFLNSLLQYTQTGEVSVKKICTCPNKNLIKGAVKNSTNACLA
jgi:hypothetical protein